eukprot:Hpha_TRINITY_DN11340_c0_g1::TRINITY_DN11340_c0_g1_i1::g.63113::m.63113
MACPTSPTTPLSQRHVPEEGARKLMSCCTTRLQQMYAMLAEQDEAASKLMLEHISRATEMVRRRTDRGRASTAAKRRRFEDELRPRVAALRDQLDQKKRDNETAAASYESTETQAKLKLEKMQDKTAQLRAKLDAMKAELNA